MVSPQSNHKNPYKRKRMKTHTHTHIDTCTKNTHTVEDNVNMDEEMDRAGYSYNLKTATTSL